MAKSTPRIQRERAQGSEYYARSAPGSKPEFVDLMRPHSNFGFVECRYQGLIPLRRILSQVRQHGGLTMVVEELDESGDIQEENEDLRLRYPDFEVGKVYRLSFFTKRFSTKKGLSSATPDEFLGYVITKEDHFPGNDNDSIIRVYESAMKPSRIKNNFIRGAKEWTCSVAGNRFKAKGYVYAQQNNITNVYAHVALRTVAARFCAAGDMTYREMNELIGVDHIKRKVGGEYGGLDTVEMRKILEFAGAKCEVIDYTDVQVV